jgi:hypothetical protein
MVGYIENASNGYDILYDGHENNGSNTKFYSQLENDDLTKLSIQGRGLPFEESDTVALGFYMSQGGNYTIAINSLDGLFGTDAQAIYLEDTQTGFVHNLRDAPYPFVAEVGETNDRFILRFTEDALGINSFNANNSITITTPNNDYVSITSHTMPLKSITIYDIAGRVIFNQTDLNINDYVINDKSLSNGTYIVKVSLANDTQKTQKVILNK